MRTRSHFLFFWVVGVISSALVASAQTFEVHGGADATFDLPGARAVAGLANLSQTPPTLVFGDSHERKLQPGVGVGMSATLFKDRLGLYIDFSHIIGDTRSVTVTAPATNPAVSLTQRDSRSFSLIQFGAQFGIRANKRIIPYFQIGTGALFFAESGTAVAVNTNTPGTSPSPPENTSYQVFLHTGVGTRIALKSFQNGRSFGIRIGIDGYYLNPPITQRLPGTSLQGDVFSALGNPRRGFGHATFGLYYQFHCDPTKKKGC